MNGFSELIDPVEQRQRFVREVSLAQDLGRENFAIPEKFLDDLTLLEKTAGAALGIDRLFMILLNQGRVKS